MKRKFYLLSAMALILTASIFNACQKDEVENINDEVQLKAALSISPNVTISASENPAYLVDGEVTVTITGSISIFTCGKALVQQEIDGSWEDVGSYDFPTTDYEFTATEVGTYNFRIHYNGNAGGCGLAQYYSSTLALEVKENECDEPLTIAAEVVSVMSSGGYYYFAAQYHVQACEAFTNLKTQGGLTAGAELVEELIDFGGTSYQTTDGYEAKFTKKNAIINWKEATIEEGFDKTYTVVFKRKLSKECTEYDITGAWSAKAWHMVTHEEPILDEFDQPTGDFQDVTVNEEYVAGYDNKLYYSTPCPE